MGLGMRHTIAKETAMSRFIAAFLSLAALSTLTALAIAPAHAAEEPDAVYFKYHRAAVTRDLDEMLLYASAAQRTELSGFSAAQKDAAMMMLESSMPRAFVLRHKAVAPDGKRARLLLSGPGGSVLDAKPETLYGTITMVNEGGAWKVGTADWSNIPPAAQAAAPAAKPAARAAGATAPAAKAAPARSGGALVGATSAPPERKLGKAKEPCVYKPVMSNEDIENCR
jgi:hypothetical protein